MRAENRLMLISIVISLAIAELILGKFFPQRTVNQYLHDRPAMFLPDKTLFMRMQPNYSGFLKEDEFRTDISTNSHGYRQEEFAVEKGTARRILAVGDSFTFGYGVEEVDSFPRIVERKLNEALDEDIEVINTGVPGWWTDAYYLFLKEHGLALQPDVVLLTLYMGNDVDGDDARNAVWPKIDDAGLPLSIDSSRLKIEGGHRVRAVRRARWRIPVLRNSHVFQLVYTSVKNLIRLTKPPAEPEPIYLVSYGPETQAIVTKVQRMIIAMRDMTQAQGAHFMITMIPERIQIYPDKAEPNSAVDYDKPQREFARFFDENGIDYLDLLPQLRAAAQTSMQELYYRRDSHFTQTGYRLTGDSIARHMLNDGVFAAQN